MQNLRAASVYRSSAGVAGEAETVLLNRGDEREKGSLCVDQRAQFENVLISVIVERRERREIERGRG